MNIPFLPLCGKSIKGEFIGFAVRINDSNDGKLLVDNGCFGKGILSRFKPDIIQRLQSNEVGSEPGKIFHRRKRKREGDVSQDENAANSTACGASVEDVQHGIKRVKTAESADLQDASELDNTMVSYPKSVEKQNLTAILSSEPLQLGLDEAFFLMFVVGCLQVYRSDSGDESVQMTAEDLWRAAIDEIPNFASKYAAYHFYRSSGWVVKSGLKMGVDYVLYEGSPQQRHARYGVVVKKMNPPSTDASTGTGAEALSWSDYSQMYRVLHNVAKKTLICYVVYDGEIDITFSPEAVLKACKIHDVEVERWIPAADRKGEDSF